MFDLLTSHPHKHMVHGEKLSGEVNTESNYKKRVAMVLHAFLVQLLNQFEQGKEERTRERKFLNICTKILKFLLGFHRINKTKLY